MEQLSRKPTETQIVWGTLVDVNVIKKVIQTLKKTHWLYKEVDNALADKAVQQVIEI